MCILLACFYTVFDNNASHFSYCDLQFAEIKKKDNVGNSGSLDEVQLLK